MLTRRRGGRKVGQTDKMADGEGEPLTLQTLRNELKLSRQASLEDFKAEIAILRRELSADIDALRSETSSNIQQQRHDVDEEIGKLRDSHKEAVAEQAEMARSLDDAIERIVQLESQKDMQLSEVKRLQDKCIDLESRSRRSNLRVFGALEDSFASTDPKVMSDFFSEILGPEHFTIPVTVDRWHRYGGPKPKKDERPRPIMVRMHYPAEKEKILKISREKGQLTYRNTPIHIYRDVPAEVDKLRAGFLPVKAKLKEAKVGYSLYHPAILSVDFDGTTHKFKTPESAMGFYDTKIAPTLAT